MDGVRQTLEQFVGRQATSALAVNAAMSVVAFMLTVRLIPALQDMFVAAGLFGKDINKVDRPKIPEALGAVCGVVYLVTLFVFIPIPFVDHLFGDRSSFPLDKLAMLLSALLCICCMIFLGFADDVIDLRWRHKLLLPTLATIPLLMVYYVEYDRTEIVIPLPLRFLWGTTVDLGLGYYVYMSLLAVFCTNSINILAGINGVEAGQSLVIAVSIAINSYVQLLDESCVENHLFSLYLMLPFIATTSALLWHNWYPSRVFVGDTFCYFAGMTFAVVGILGHFSKTMCLFFIPQGFNFILSVPQLFHWVECPRHRLPKLNPATGLLEPSRASMQDSTPLGRLITRIFAAFGLVQIFYRPEDKTHDLSKAEVSNFTIINTILIWVGPTHEGTLTVYVLLVQALFSAMAFVIRYPLASIVYG